MKQTSDRTRTSAKAPERQDVPAPAPSPRTLWTLVALGAASALWAAFLWRQLLVARAGGAPVCGPGEGDCAALWDGDFASWVQAATGVPVAGWGVVWGAVALLLPLLVLLRSKDGAAPADLLSGVKWAAVGGAAAVAVFLMVSAVEGTFCLPCFGSHSLALAYGGVALVGWSKLGWPQAGRGLGTAGALGLAAFLLLLYPGSRTPPARTELSQIIPPTVPPAGQPAAGATPAATRPPAVDEDPASPPAAPASLDAFVASLNPAMQQALSDSLATYRAAPEATPRDSRLVLGAMSAPVRITEFTDILCPHCADLHRTLDYLQEQVPPGSIQIEPRQYPLDGACNPQVQRSGQPVRCVAAKALICAETRPGSYFQLAGELFAEQRSLTPERTLELASRHVPRAELEPCLASEETQAKIAADVREASRHDFHGTPLVLVNGRQGSPYGPFLYALALSRGVPWHPAFNMLPPPRPPAAHEH